MTGREAELIVVVVAIDGEFAIRHPAHEIALDTRLGGNCADKQKSQDHQSDARH